MTLKLVPFFLAVPLLVSGCAHYPRNARLTASDIPTGYRFQKTASPTNSSDLLLMLAFSGGGTRAASLSYGVLEELARTPVVLEGTQHRVLDEVDIISSVSGGSFTAAYYALWGDRIFSDFESKFLKKESDRRFFNSVPTSLALPSKTVDRLRQLAARELARNAEFRRLVGGLGGEPGKSDSPDRPSLATARLRNPKASNTSHTYGTHQ